MLKEDKVTYIDEPYYVPNEEIEPGMVVEYEFGDYNHYVQTGVLSMLRDENGWWRMYGERTTQTNWTTMDSAHSRDGGGKMLIGYFDLDEYYAENPEKIEEVAQKDAEFYGE